MYFLLFSVSAGCERLRFMSFDELKLAVVLISLFFFWTTILRQDPRLTVRIFLLFCAVGFVTQILLGRELNRYTPNITLYISYVSISVVAAWGGGLTSVWAIHSRLTNFLGKPPGLGTYALCGIPTLVLLEVIGSNLIRMKLHDYTQYAALMPYLHSMNAPKWLYAYYIAVGIICFYLSKALGFYGETWKNPGVRRVLSLAPGDDEG
jgi:hypothetical protein